MVPRLLLHPAALVSIRSVVGLMVTAPTDGTTQVFVTLILLDTIGQYIVGLGDEIDRCVPRFDTADSAGLP